MQAVLTLLWIVEMLGIALTIEEFVLKLTDVSHQTLPF